MPNWKAPWPQSFRPTPGEFAVQFQTLSVALATAGPTLVGTNTTNVFVGTPAGLSFFVAGASMVGGSAFTGSGAVTATLNKKSGSTVTALTAAYDLTGALSTAGYADVPITATDQNATLAAGDVLYWTVIAAGTLGGGDLRAIVGASIIG